MNNSKLSKLSNLEVKDHGIFITSTELEEGILKEPLVPNLELIVADFKGKELDLVIEHASHKFLSDDIFIKSRVFLINFQ